MVLVCFVLLSVITALQMSEGLGLCHLVNPHDGRWALVHVACCTAQMLLLLLLLLLQPACLPVVVVTLATSLMTS